MLAPITDTPGFLREARPAGARWFYIAISNPEFAADPMVAEAVEKLQEAMYAMCDAGKAIDASIKMTQSSPPQALSPDGHVRGSEDY